MVNINPFKNSNPMTLLDAVKLSSILTVASYFTTFLLPYDYSDIKVAMANFIFNSIKFLGGVFFTNLVSLAGLAQLTKGGEDKVEIKTVAPS